MTEHDERSAYCRARHAHCTLLVPDCDYELIRVCALVCPSDTRGASSRDAAGLHCVLRPAYCTLDGPMHVDVVKK